MAQKLIILGEYNPDWETHRFTNASIEHSLAAVGETLAVSWCSTKDANQQVLKEASGVWIATGAPYQNMNNALQAIRYVREHNIPCLGTCQGFQHIMLEYAQTFLGIENPGHAEYDADGATPFISALPCSLKGQEMSLSIVDGSLAQRIYGSTKTTEKYYCSFGIHPDFFPSVKNGPIHVSGLDSEGAIRIVEYPEHPFMIGTLFVPQSRSLKEMPHPLITAFVRAVAMR